jgi:hypothetical protein
MCSNVWKGMRKVAKNKQKMGWKNNGWKRNGGREDRKES